MKNTKNVLIVSFLLAGLLLSACQGTIVRGSGRVITQSRPVSGFTAVSLSGMGDVTFTQGGQESLTIEAEDNILPHITTEVKGGTLTIAEDSANHHVWLQPSRPIRFNLTVKNLNSFVLSGAGRIQSASLKTDHLNLNISGTGNIQIDNLDASSLSSTISGAGNVEVSGKVDRQDANLNGVGNYHTSNLQSQSANMVINGTGDATVWVKENLSVAIAGAGSVNYYGKPQVSQNIAGAGAIKNLGDK
jgi:hypothetical protein